LPLADDGRSSLWTHGRNNAIGRTGIGETDIFTNVELR